MELTQLKYFQAMAKCRHFTQAAEEMAVSQSALSRSIQKLEQELGVTLFERHGRTSDLTEAGQKFLFHVDRVIRELALAEQEIELDNGGAGVVHLSFLHSLGDTFLPLILRQFHERYPHIDVKLNQQSSSMLAEQLTSGETDICLCSTMNEPDTAWMYLWSEEMFLVVPEDHPLAQKKNATIMDCREYTMLTGLEHSVEDRLLRKTYGEQNIAWKRVIRSDSIDTVMKMVKSGSGIAIGPKSFAEYYGVTAVPLVPARQDSLYFACLKSKKKEPEIREFQRYLTTLVSSVCPD